MLSIRDARIEVFKPDNSTNDPDFVVPGEDIQSVDASIRAGQSKDQGRIIISNDDGSYTQDDQQINSGDRLLFWVSSDTFMREWGAEDWGTGVWGGELDRWDAMVRDREMEYVSPSISDLTLTCEDFVMSIASKRRVYNNFRGDQATGNDDAVLETILDNNAEEEIGRSKIETFDENVWISWDGETLFKAIGELAERVDAVVYGRKGDLVFKPLGQIDTKFELDGTEIGRLKTKETDAGMVNRVRVDGGEATSLDDEQPNQSDYTTVSFNTQKQFRINTRKSEVAFIEIWTNPTGSEEAITVRLQKDDGGQPIAPDDESSDITSRTLEHQFLADDGFTTFLLGEHTLPEPNPWVIVESDGTSGQEIGVDSNGNATYRSHYGFNVTVRNTSQSSRDKYRLREGRIQDKSIQTPEEGRDISQAKLDHDSVPEHTVEAPADSDRTHNLEPLDIVELDFPRERAVGQYMVTERNDQYEGSNLETTFTLQEVSSI